MFLTIPVLAVLGCSQRPDPPDGFEQPCDSGSHPCPNDLLCRLSDWDYQFDDEIYRCRAPCAVSEDCRFACPNCSYRCVDGACDHYLRE